MRGLAGMCDGFSIHSTPNDHHNCKPKRVADRLDFGSSVVVFVLFRESKRRLKAAVTGLSRREFSIFTADFV